MENNNIKGRFGMTVRKLLIEQKKTLLIMAGSYLGFCAILGLWGGLMEAYLCVWFSAIRIFSRSDLRTTHGYHFPTPSSILQKIMRLPCAG